MPKIKRIQYGDSFMLRFECPGCGYNHGFTDKKDMEEGWEFNGDYQNPTVSPSILVTNGNIDYRCHSFIRDGKIQFLSDCTHKLKNKTVELPEII